ncbi:hypothetical protein EDB94_2901 [Marinobacter sp. 3-2]|jgi:hypothetical protein|nr:hypothetical protein EDB94_2901 [Marinobacter sp. 3-2]
MVMPFSRLNVRFATAANVRKSHGYLVVSGKEVTLATAESSKRFSRGEQGSYEFVATNNTADRRAANF